MRASLPRVRVVARYFLMQVPGWLAVVALLVILNAWLDLPAWIGLIVMAAWVVKDILMYPLLRRAYHDDVPGPALRLVGQVGRVERDLAPKGFVRVGNELWIGEVLPEHQPVSSGRPVRVRSIDGLTLLVEPVRESPPGGGPVSGGSGTT